MRTLTETFTDARDSGTPLVMVQTPNQFDAVAAICNATDGAPKLLWDAQRGVQGINKPGIAFVLKLSGASEEEKATWRQNTQNPATALEVAEKMPPASDTAPGSIMFLVNAHRFVQDAFVSTGILNLREPFKMSGRTLVLLSPTPDCLPVELRQDIIVIEDPLPGDAQIRAIIERLLSTNGITETEANVGRSINALRGLSSFGVEQVLAMSIRKSGIDVEALWERKRKQIEMTRGLRLRLTGPKFTDTGGNTQLLADFDDIMESDERPAAIVWWDEFEKTGAASNTVGENSVERDFKGRFLTWMEENRFDGVILVGGAGTGKSLAAQSIGPQYGLPTFVMDPGAMKGELMGQSEQYVRAALDTMATAAGGRLFIVATCNRLQDISPEIRRRFTSGIYYVDLPNESERHAIAKIQLAAHGLDASLEDEMVRATENWTGAEIRNLCRIMRRPASKRASNPLAYAATKVVPVFQSAPKSIEDLRRLAHGSFLSANHPGTYQLPGTDEVPVDAVRRIKTKES